MIILDTNVISALMRQDADAVVVGWLDGNRRSSIWITAVTVFEVHFGLELLAQGRRRRQLEDAFARALEEDFEGRILPFERSAARAAAMIAARQRQGRPLDRDPRCADRGDRRRPARDAGDPQHPPLRGLGIALIDPWRASWTAG